MIEPSTVADATVVLAFPLPGLKELVSKAVSEPRAVATGSQNQAELQDPIATAPGSDTNSKRPG